jgi:cell division protein ZipA
MNWSLMLNALLLIGVVIAIVRTVQTRRQQEVQKTVQNLSGSPAPTSNFDDIIAVRKVNHNPSVTPTIKPSIVVPPRQPSYPSIKPQRSLDPSINKPTVQSVPAPEGVENVVQARPANTETVMPNAESLMIFLLAKSNRQLAGYELLQAVLSAGFRFGEGGLFHRHQYPNCQGPVMCSLAAATPTGVFDLQNIGGFVVHPGPFQGPGRLVFQA